MDQKGRRFDFVIAGALLLVVPLGLSAGFLAIADCPTFIPVDSKVEKKPEDRGDFCLCREGAFRSCAGGSSGAS